MKHPITKSHLTGEKKNLIFHRTKVINCHQIKRMSIIELKNNKHKSLEITDSSPAKRLSLLSNEECDILSSKRDSYKSLTFHHPIQIGPYIYVPIPFIPTQNETSNQDNKPLDLTKPKKISIECDQSLNSPLDLSVEKRKKMIQEKLYQCKSCSIHFRSLKTLQAHQENYCHEFRKQKKQKLTTTIDSIR